VAIHVAHEKNIVFFLFSPIARTARLALEVRTEQAKSSRKGATCATGRVCVMPLHPSATQYPDDDGDNGDGAGEADPSTDVAPFSSSVFVFPVAGDAPHPVPAIALDVDQGDGFAASGGKVMVSPVVASDAPAVEEMERPHSVESDPASDSESIPHTPTSMPRTPTRQRLVLPASRVSAGLKDLKVQFEMDTPMSQTGSHGSSDKVSLFAAHA